MNDERTTGHELRSMQKLLTIDEAAARLQLKPDAVEALIAGGELTAYQLGGQFLRVSADQVEAWAVRRAALRPARSGVRSQSVGIPPSTRRTFSDGLRDLLYVYDGYVAAVALMAVIVYLVCRSG